MYKGYQCHGADVNKAIRESCMEFLRASRLSSDSYHKSMIKSTANSQRVKQKIDEYLESQNIDFGYVLLNLMPEFLRGMGSVEEVQMSLRMLSHEIDEWCSLPPNVLSVVLNIANGGSAPQDVDMSPYLQGTTSSARH